MSTYVVSIRQICLSLCAAISNHPLIKNPPIYYPIVKPGQSPQQITINKYRTYGGIELNNINKSSLTCAVYPAFVSRNVKTGNASTDRDNQKSIVYTPYTLGKSSPNNDSLEKVTFKLIVELHYHDVSVNAGSSLINFASSNPSIFNTFNQIPTDNYKYLLTEKSNGFSPITDSTTIDRFVNDNFNERNQTSLSSLNIEINPGEEILRDYMELLRIVLNQTAIEPFGARSLTVRNIDFPTSNWLQENKNVFFHLASMVVDVELYLPCTNYLFSSPLPIQNINIE